MSKKKVVSLDEAKRALKQDDEGGQDQAQDQAQDVGQQDAEQKVPGMGDRPCYRVYLRKTGDMSPGVWHFGTKATKNEGDLPTQQWVCSPIIIKALTSTPDESNFGRLLEYSNSLGHWKQWSMPMSLLAGSGEEMRAALLDAGVIISPTGKNLLSSYLQSVTPKLRMTCALQTGWHGDSAFVLPDTVIGPESGTVVIQASRQMENEFTVAGDIGGWIEGISAMATGNPMLALPISAAFAGPLLKKVSAESGGIHLVDDSSTGKTSALEAASSVWGGQNFKRSWRATANGLEGAAVGFNDVLLALDEISECDPREVGAIVYSLANGKGKQRAGRTGAARPVMTWRCVVLSTGERTITTSMEEGGRRPKAGQTVRILDVHCKREHGIYDVLHGFASGAALSDHIKRTAKQHHGHVGRRFLQMLTADTRNFAEMYAEIKGREEFSVGDAQGQARRAASRFALICMAGELATEYGLTGWDQYEANSAASVGLKLWMEGHGKTNVESKGALDDIQAFVDRHGDSRFSPVDSVAKSVVHNRAGWVSGATWYFTADGLREATKGKDFSRALDALTAAGWLMEPDEKTGKRTSVIRVDGVPRRLYAITPTDGET